MATAKQVCTIKPGHFVALTVDKRTVRGKVTERQGSMLTIEVGQGGPVVKREVRNVFPLWSPTSGRIFIKGYEAK